jgi:hypothetical protein
VSLRRPGGGGSGRRGTEERRGAGCWWCGWSGRETGARGMGGAGGASGRQRRGGSGGEGATRCREGVGLGPDRRVALCEQGRSVL